MTDPAARPSHLTVVQLLPALANGGAERSALEVSRALVAAGHRSIVISAGGRLVAQLERDGGEHIVLEIGRKSPWTLTRVPALRRTLTRLAPDIVHARSRMPAWIAWYALRGMRPRPAFVTTVHGLNSPGRWSSIMTRGDRVIAVSQTVRDFVLGHYPQVDAARISVIPRGINADAFPYGYRPEPAWRDAFFKEYPQLAGAPLLTLPGRGTRLKGHADAIALVAGLRERSVDVRLLLLGIIEPGREAYVREMRGLAEAHGVADIVAFSPPRSDVRDVFSVSDLILQLSNKPESFGRTVIEALALCRPVLGYAQGGVGELLAELYPAGRVPAGDVGKLIVRTVELLGGAPPIAPMQQRYRLADMQASVLALYDQLAAERAARRSDPLTAGA